MLKVEEVANRLGMDSRTVQRLINDGKLPAFRFAKREFRVNETDLDEFIKNSKVGGNKDKIWRL